MKKIILGQERRISGSDFVLSRRRFRRAAGGSLQARTRPADERLQGCRSKLRTQMGMHHRQEANQPEVRIQVVD